MRAGLVRCEERYPLDGPHSVVVAVVDRDALLWREKLAPLHRELFGNGHSDPLAPVKLEVIDRATDDAITRLVEAGLIARTTRAARSLHPPDVIAADPNALTEAERQQVATHRARASRKLRLAALFGQEDFQEETRHALLEAIHCGARAHAVESRLPEPMEIKDTLLPPLALHWGESLPALREFVSNPASDWKPIGNLLSSVLQMQPANASSP